MSGPYPPPPQRWASAPAHWNHQGFPADPQPGQAPPVPRWQAPPPRRSAPSGLLVALLSVAALAVVSVVALSVILLGRDERAEPVPPPPPPPSPAPSSAPPSESPGGSGHRTPQQDREEVPYPELPASEAEARSLVEDHPLYRTDLGAGRQCDQVPDPVGHPSGDEEELRSVLLAKMDCTHDLWAPAFEEAGYQATRIDIITFAGTGESPCGSSSAGAFYCAANQTMYLNTALQGRAASELPWGYYLWALDHEMGHHLQLRSGILLASHQLSQTESTQDDALRWNRRIELQANCMSGSSLHRTGSMDRDTFHGHVSNVQGEEVHGTVENQVAWAELGWDHSTVAECNTYVAADEQVA